MTATSDLLARLRRHYIKPGPWAGGIFLPEVTLGVAGGQRCDAIYVGFTNASGRRLVGHELKVSRADWRRELDKAGKADAWADQCHAWYIVAPSTEIVPVEELPDGWGLMVPNPRTTTRMTVAVKAHVHRDRTPSWQAARSVMQRADTLRNSDVERAAAEARKEAREGLDDLVEAEIARRGGAGVRRLTEDLRKLREHHAALIDAIGVNVKGDDDYAWRDDVTVSELRAAVGLIRTYGTASKAAEQMGKRLEFIRHELERASKRIGGIDPVAALAAGEQ